MTANFYQHKQWFARVTIMLLAVTLGACATTSSSSRPSATIAIQEDVGFTITEAAPVDNNVRIEYLEA